MSATRIPSLNLLRTFEVAARHLSFKCAASELCVTPPAVSHQIRSLERKLGKKLFVREAKSLALTHAGSHYYNKVSDAIRQLESATTELYSDKWHRTSKFRISAIPFIAQEILMPNIDRLHQRYAGVELEVEPGILREDLSFYGVNYMIRHGNGQKRGLHYTKLIDTSITPVCSPDYWYGHQSKESNPMTTLRLSSDKYTWDLWLQTWKESPERWKESIILDSYEEVIQASCQGMGMAMGIRPLVDSYLKQNWLIQPFPCQLIGTESLYFVCREEDKSKEETNAIREWLLDLFKYLTELN